jgi:phosphoglycolate phosphatase
MLKLLIFDLDGTLADTAIDITNAVNYALKPFGIRPFSVEEIKRMVGSGITNLLHSLIPPEHISDHTLKDVVERFLVYYSEHILDNTVAYPHVKETLQQLGAYKKAVISNKRESFSKKVLEGIGILQYFDIVLGSDSVSERKPSPVPVLEVLKRLGVSKDEAIMIGDSNYDIQTARAADVRVIAVTYGFRPKEMLKDADYMIDDFGELLRLLPSLS